MYIYILTYILSVWVCVSACACACVCACVSVCARGVSLCVFVCVCAVSQCVCVLHGGLALFITHPRDLHETLTTDLESEADMKDDPRKRS